jgi:histone acetyltransferase (RNA polymerase elongator complex component)
MTEKPLIVPIFIPNEGCPYRCVYCHQEKITSQSTERVNASTIARTLDKAIHSGRFHPARKPEVAFYGGTFTRLTTARIKELLGAVGPYLKKGFFQSVRISTRPDAVVNKPLDLLRNLGVSTVELGAQSMDDGVLERSQRGHTAQDTVDSVRLLKESGFRVGIQLMPGLPGDTPETFMQTVQKVVNLRPHMVRLYPTIVIKGTALEKWVVEKRYEPLTLEEAVKICQESCVTLEESGIPVIRIGLMSSPTLLEDNQIVAGPWHNAFGFLVRSRIHQKRIESCLPQRGLTAEMRLRIPTREIPLVRGYKNQGLRSIEEKTGAKVTEVIGDDRVPSGEVAVDLLTAKPMKGEHPTPACHASQTTV